MIGKLICPQTYDFNEPFLLGTLGDWVEVDKAMRYTHGIVNVGGTHRKVSNINFKQVLNQFLKIQDLKGIDSFAHEYGLLGSGYDLPEYFSKFEKFDYANNCFEPIHIWKWHIRNVQRLIRLYDILKKAKENIEYDYERALSQILYLDERGGVYWYTEGTIIDERKFSIKYDFTGIKNRHNKRDLLPLAFEVLTFSVSFALQGAIDIQYSAIPDNKARLGFRIAENPSTRYLIAAMYYYIWQMITHTKNVITCAVCGGFFEKSGRRKWCSDACRQAKHRIESGKQKK